MSATFNKIILMGNLTRDPELKYTPSGTGLAEFSLAMNRKYQGKEETTYIDVTAFGKQAELVAEYCQKGKHVLVDGRLEQQRWEDKSGNKRSKHKVIAFNVTFLDGGKRATPETGAGADDDERF